MEPLGPEAERYLRAAVEGLPVWERGLQTRGPRFGLHHELGVAYNAIGEHERALKHLQQEIDCLRAHPLPRWRGGTMGLATAYSNLAGVLVRLERWDEVDAAIEAG